MFADVLKKLRNSKNLSQEDLANIIGVSKSTIGMYEQGKRMPKADATLKKLADYFNVSIDYLLGLSENRFFEIVDTNDSIASNLQTTLTENELPLSESQKAILQLSELLSDKNIKKLIDYAELLKKADNDS